MNIGVTLGVVVCIALRIVLPFMLTLLTGSIINAWQERRAAAVRKMLQTQNE